MPASHTFDELFQAVHQMKGSDGKLAKVRTSFQDFAGHIQGTSAGIKDALSTLNQVQMSGNAITAIADQTNSTATVAQNLVDTNQPNIQALTHAIDYTDSTYQNMVDLKAEHDGAIRDAKAGVGIMIPGTYPMVAPGPSVQQVEDMYVKQALDDYINPWLGQLGETASTIAKSKDKMAPMGGLHLADPSQASPVDQQAPGPQPTGTAPTNSPAPGGGGGPTGPPTDAAKNAGPMPPGSPQSGPSQSGSQPPGSPQPGSSQSGSQPPGSPSPGSTSFPANMPTNPILASAQPPSTVLPSFKPASTSLPNTVTPSIPLTPFQTIPSLTANAAAPFKSVGSLPSGSVGGSVNTGVAQQSGNASPNEAGVPLAGLAGQAATAKPPVGGMPYMPGMGGMGGMGAAGAGGAQIKPGVAQQPGVPGLGGPGAIKPKRLGVRPELAGRADGGRPGQPAAKPAKSSRKGRKAAAGREVLDEELWKVEDKASSASASGSRGRGRR